MINTIKEFNVEIRNQNILKLVELSMNNKELNLLSKDEEKELLTEVKSSYKVKTKKLR